jgi:hypothetical protein
MFNLEEDQRKSRNTAIGKGHPWPEEAQGVPGRLRTRIFVTFDATRVVSRQPSAPGAFTQGEILGTHFQLLSRTQGTRFRRGEPRKKSPVTPRGIDPENVRQERSALITNYSYTFSLTSALDGGGCSMPRHGRLTLGKGTWHLLYRRLIGSQEGSGLVRNISPLLKFDPRILQPVASSYTNYAGLAHLRQSTLGNTQHFSVCCFGCAKMLFVFSMIDVTNETWEPNTCNFERR